MKTRRRRRCRLRLVTLSPRGLRVLTGFHFLRELDTTDNEWATRRRLGARAGEIEAQA